MKIKWLGHACFLITSNKGLKIITDPYATGGMRGLFKYGPVKEYADIVTISHQHSDHNYTGDLQGKPEIVQGVGKHLAKVMEFTGVASYHDKTSGRERGENTIFCFTVDNIKVCHCGDLGHTLDSNALSAIGQVDILLFPTGGPMATIELNEAAEVWDKIKPGVIIPMHFHTDKCAFPGYSKEDLLKLKLNAILVGKSEVDFVAGKIPSGQIMILEPAL
jgi:L-ascorbate metabolism protein UlaG (beta-lactamase superfamily)